MKKFSYLLVLAIVVVSRVFSANFNNHHVANSAVTNASRIVDIFNGGLWVLSDPSMDLDHGAYPSNASGQGTPMYTLANPLTYVMNPYYNPAPWGMQQYITLPGDNNYTTLKYNVYVKLPKSQSNLVVDRLTISITPSQMTATTANNGTVTFTPYPGGNPNLFSLLYTPHPSVIPTPTSYASGTLYRGINLPGGEFPSPQLPSYTYAVYYIYRGMNVVRIPFSWESIQPDVTVPINFSAVGSHAYNLAQFVSNLHAASPGMHIILDMHNYMRYPANPDPNSVHIIGADGPTTAQYAAAWGEIATQFKIYPNVMFDLMNEPHNMDTELILTNYNAAIAAIRGAGATNLLLLEGNQYSCLGTWSLPGPNSELPNNLVFVPPGMGMAPGIVDPGSNYAINVHQYFSGNANLTLPCGSGEGYDCAVAENVLSIENFSTFTSYLQTYSLKAFLTETNAAGFLPPSPGTEPNTNCVACVNNFLQAVEANALSVHSTWGFIGWTAWSSLNIILTDPLSLGVNPDGTDRPQWTGAYNNWLTPPTWPAPP